MIAAAASAVGINMTFFMPFVLLRRKWGREHRGLAKFDLWTALLDSVCRCNLLRRHRSRLSIQRQT